MADDAVYRAAFIRMHPTGKVVLSLSEASQGKEAEDLAGIVSRRARDPARGRQGRPRGRRPLRRGQQLQLGPQRRGRRGNVAATARKLRDKAQIVAGAMLGVRPDALNYDNGHWTADGRRPGGSQDPGGRGRAAFGGFEMPDGLDGSLDAQTTYRLGAAQPAA